MTSYRGYGIRSNGRIKRGAYLAASTPVEARLAAVELCEDEIDHIEVWADARKIDEVECHDSDEESGGGPGSGSGRSNAAASAS